jgi:DNA-directed RNA polymerase specialized sigma24 family protein
MENSLERVERLLALLLIQDMKGQQEKATQLSIAGFSNLEIADILQTSSGVIAQLLYTSRKAKGKKK